VILMQNDSQYWAFELESDYPLQVISYSTRKTDNILHWHDYLEIGLCIEGTGTFKFASRTYPVASGDIFIINNYEQHVAFSSQSTKDLTFIFIIFLSKLITPVGSSLFTNEYLTPFWHGSELCSHRLPATLHISSQVSSEIQDMYRIWQSKSMAYRHLCESSLRKILALLLSFYGYQQDEAHSKLLNLRMRLQKAMSYIQENACRQITLAEVAAQVNMSSSYFRHSFTKAMSISFSEYIGLLRISKARDLLIKTDVTVASIVAEVGYSNEYYFYCLFKRHMHMTPDQYRKQYQNFS